MAPATLKPVKDSGKGYRGRLAPSPTGLLHVGHARTFWMAYTRARERGGTLVMRMDDLDQERSRAEFAEAAIEDLRWLGIRWQEGPGAVGKGVHGTAGSYGPYVQSKRYAIYRDAFQKLLRRGYLFPCRCSRRELAMAASAPHEGGVLRTGGAVVAGMDDEVVYPGTCRHLTWETGQLPGPTASRFGPEAANWRFKVNDGLAVEFVDENLGPQRFVCGEDFGDFLVWRRDGVPSYQLACAVDDAAMEMTEVVRGADLLKSTARQLLLMKALGVEPPGWFHCALVADHNGQRLAKRHDALSLRALRQRGLTPMNVFSAELPVLA